jgi:DNA polymerase-4
MSAPGQGPPGERGERADEAAAQGAADAAAETTTRGSNILHVDMDAFFASVEIRDDPSLAGKPVVVGGKGDRGVVAAASYEARVYGVHSAMPSARARRLCPDAVWLPGRYDRYTEVSRELHGLFHEVTPLVEGIALDEAFLDVTGARRLFGQPVEIARVLRARIADVLGLRASVGVARSKLLAKLASEAAKPRVQASGSVDEGPGVVVIEPDRELEFLHPLPVRALWGVGPATQKRLDRYGISTIGELAALPLETLVSALGTSLGRHLHDLAWARDPRTVVPEQAAKSIGHEETYGRDLAGAADLRREVIRLADAVATRLRRAGVAARTVTLKVRFPDFRTVTRSRTLPDATDVGHEIATTAITLLEALDTAAGVRLLGVSCSHLGPPPSRQLELLDEQGAAPHDPHRLAADAIDDIRRRFGDDAVGPATLAAAGGLRVKKKGDTQWGPSGPSGPPDARMEGRNGPVERDTEGPDRPAGRGRVLRRDEPG